MSCLEFGSQDLDLMTNRVVFLSWKLLRSLLLIGFLVFAAVLYVVPQSLVYNV